MEVVLYWGAVRNILEDMEWPSEAKNFDKRLEACMVKAGGHFEHFMTDSHQFIGCNSVVQSQLHEQKLYSIRYVYNIIMYSYIFKD